LNSILRKIFLGSAMAVSAFLVGCAGPAPNYTPLVDNIEALKKSGAAPLKTGTIGVTAGMPGANAVSIRAASMVTPVGANYGDYVAAALKQELELAKLYNPQAATEVSGTLTVNNIDAGGISVNSGQIEARFLVTKNGEVRFDKVKRAERQWEGSFAGGIAIPTAANNYPLMVQQLINALLIDPDFVKAVRN
jgi:hypothetical protein